VDISYDYNGSLNGEFGRRYDNMMRVTTLTVNGTATSYSYDNDGLLIGAGDIILTRDTQTGFLPGTTNMDYYNAQ